MLPTVVTRGRLLEANSLFQVTFTASQLIGFVILGPLVVNLWGTDALFWMIGGMLALATLFVWPLPSTHRRIDQQIGGFRDLWHEIFDVLRYVRTDRVISLAVVQWTVGTTLMLIVATLAPNFVVHILQVRAEDSVFVLAPAGVGTVLGSLALGRYGARLDRLRLVRTAMVAVGLLVCLMALAGPVWQSLGWVSYVEGTDSTFWGHWSLVCTVMALAFVAGAGFVLILVPTQTLIQERADEGVRGRLFAVQLVLANLASILPLVVLGELADVWGVPVTLGLVGLAVLAAGAWSAQRAPVLQGSDGADRTSSAA
jgi:predicted MFS family arabinose efflux permease